MTTYRKLSFALCICLAIALYVPTVSAACCEDGETKRDDDDCTMYYYCCTGEFVHKSCGEGECWNNRTNCCEVDIGQCYCDIPEPDCEEGSTKWDSYDCAKYYQCSKGQYVSMSCQDKYYFNNRTQKCEVDKGQCKAVCTEGTNTTDSADCTKFYKCSNGQLVSVSCPVNQYYNNKTYDCEDDKGQCKAVCTEGTNTTDSLDCTKFYKCSNGQLVSVSCPVNQYYNNKTYDCEDDKGQCKAVCTEGTNTTDSLDCTKFYKCSNGQLVSASCPDNQYYNNKTYKCEVDKGECRPVCTEGSNMTDTANCTKFYKCSSGQYVSVACDVGYYFDGKNCAKNTGQCVVDQENCKEGEITPNPGNCAGYLECINNQNVAKKCPPSTFFNVTANACTYDTDGVCIPKDCDPECCDQPNGWLSSVDKNCSAFMQCAGGKSVIKRCGYNLQFNNDTKQCDYPQNVRCDDGTLPPSGPTAGPSGLACPSGGVCVGKPDGEMFGSTTKTCSSQYIICQCECEVQMNCAPGTMYNANIYACDWPQNVKGC